MTFFSFLFAFHFWETIETFLVYQTGNLTGKRLKSGREKIGKSGFAPPPRKIYCYALDSSEPFIVVPPFRTYHIIYVRFHVPFRHENLKNILSLNQILPHIPVTFPASPFHIVGLFKRLEAKHYKGFVCPNGTDPKNLNILAVRIFSF